MAVVGVVAVVEDKKPLEWPFSQMTSLWLNSQVWAFGGFTDSALM